MTADAPLGPIVAIDGPAGSGKSTVARAIADRLGFDYLDTGAMYRAVAFAALRSNIDPDDREDVAALAVSTEIDVSDERVLVDGFDATVEIRGPEVTRSVSAVAEIPEVRAELRRQQQYWARTHGGGVIEGRDIGTVVFPDAILKVYLSARPDVRARRRAKEVTDLEYETVAADLARRDAIDTARQHDPLAQAPDAFIVDTTDLDVEGVVDVVVAELERRLAAAADPDG